MNAGQRVAVGQIQRPQLWQLHGVDQHLLNFTTGCEAEYFKLRGFLHEYFFDQIVNIQRRQHSGEHSKLLERWQPRPHCEPREKATMEFNISQFRRDNERSLDLVALRGRQHLQRRAHFRQLAHMVVLEIVHPRQLRRLQLRPLAADALDRKRQFIVTELAVLQNQRLHAWEVIGGEHDALVVAQVCTHERVRVVWQQREARAARGAHLAEFLERQEGTDEQQRDRFDKHSDLIPCLSKDRKIAAAVQSESQCKQRKMLCRARAQRHALLLLLLSVAASHAWALGSVPTLDAETQLLAHDDSERHESTHRGFAIDTAGPSEAPGTDAEALFKEALRLYAQSQPVEAVEFAQRAVQLSRTVPRLYFLGQAHRELGHSDLAFRYFREAFDVAASLSHVLPLDQEYLLNLQYAELLRQTHSSTEQQSVNELKQQAIRHYERALNTDLLWNDGNLPLALMNMGEMEAALRVNEQALRLDPNRSHLLHNMDNILHALGREEEAFEHFEHAYQINPNEPETLNIIAVYYAVNGNMNEALQFLQRTFVIAEAALAENPSQYEAIGAYNCAQLRLASARLPLVYQSVDEIVEARAQYISCLEALLSESRAPLVLPDPVSTVSMGSMGYYAVYQRFNDVGIRSQLARVYRKGAPTLSFTASHVLRDRNKTYQFTFPSSTSSRMNRKAQRIAKRYAKYSNDAVHANRRIRVGFHSGSMRQHSVGLLTQGVITKLPRDAFEVIVIIYDSDERDELTELVLQSVDSVVFLRQELEQAQRQVSDLELDVLVFTEIGMHIRTYFLAFSRLALRTAMFWVHAVTSGIDTVDYFVSSKRFDDDRAEQLFANKSQGGVNEQQSKYTECIYEMDHLTTYFLDPLASQDQLMPPSHALLRESLGLPPKDVLPVMILVPQTLYKLHPDFDILIERVLSGVPETSFLAVPTGFMPWLADAVRERWRRTLSPLVYKRVYFLRRLNTTEFLDVCAMAGLVLDPFPVGGGRSSFEIFSVGTPIVTLAPRTTILQLMAAMYNVMGVADLIAYSEDEFVEIAVLLAQDEKLRAQARELILEHKYKLYENAAVIREWETFLISILAAKPPQERASGRTTDAARVASECPHALPLIPVNEPFFELNVFLFGAVDHYNHFVGITLKLPSEGEDPFEVSKELAERFEPPLDSLQQSFIAKTMWNAKHRQLQPVVMTVNVSVTANVYAPVEIRYGDDLHFVLQMHLEKHRSKMDETIRSVWKISHVIEVAAGQLKQLLPEYSSPAWIAARSFPLRASNASNRDAQHNSRRECVTLVMTTCKRLSLFLRTIASLQRALGIVQESDWFKWFCHMLVVDDNSSPSDRDAMKAHSPQSFEFLLKTPDQRGHAKSLNLAIERVQSQFVFYLEDDWEFVNYTTREGNDTSPSSTFLDDTLTILRGNSSREYEPLAQVLLKNYEGGWLRQLGSIRYFVHEFAANDPALPFAFWPGFSLNPGLWNLGAILEAMEWDESVDQPRQRPIFDEVSDRFEALFACELWRTGVRITYLDGEFISHTGAPLGTNASAYVLNDLPRRSDFVESFARSAFPLR
ncbi:N-terminal acetyltransferase a complex subunit nat1, partial [Globisporangium splendens]